MTDKAPDIVVRLRAAARDPRNAGFLRALLTEAADRIEELRFWLTRKKPSETEPPKDAK